MKALDLPAELVGQKQRRERIGHRVPAESGVWRQDQRPIQVPGREMLRECSAEHFGVVVEGDEVSDSVEEHLAVLGRRLLAVDLADARDRRLSVSVLPDRGVHETRRLVFQVEEGLLRLVQVPAEGARMTVRRHQQDMNGVSHGRVPRGEHKRAL